MLGFEGYSWHTHAEILAALSNTTQEAAIERFVDALLGNRVVIAVSIVAGRIAGVWVSDDPTKADRYKPDDEAIAFRFWDGTPWVSSAP